MAFTIHKTSPEDAESIAKIYVASRVSNDIWARLIEDVSPEDHLAWITAMYQHRQESPNWQFYKAVETATGYVPSR
jgi:hypothetical protein